VHCGYFPALVAVDFIDGDKTPDILVAGMHGLSIGFGRGDAVYGDAQSVIVGGISSIPPTGPIAAGDFDGDGHVDLVTVDDTGLRVFYGDGHGGYTQGPHIDSDSQRPYVVRASDVNADNRSDVIAMNVATVQVFHGQSNRTFDNGWRSAYF